MTTPNFESLSIRGIEEISEMRTVEELQKEVWGIDDREVFPALAMMPMREVGGVLIGAPVPLLVRVRQLRRADQHPSHAQGKHPPRGPLQDRREL